MCVCVCGRACRRAKNKTKESKRGSKVLVSGSGLKAVFEHDFVNGALL